MVSCTCLVPALQDAGGRCTRCFYPVAHQYTRKDPMTTTLNSDWVTDRACMAGRVVRYHTWAVHHQQTVGEHSWQVARIYEEIFGSPTAEVERFIRHHDSAEVVVGDPPFPVKRDSPQLKAGYDELEPKALDRLGIVLPSPYFKELIKVKICDLLEMTLFGMIEREMGNLLACPIIVRTCNVALQLADKHLDPDEWNAVSVWVMNQRERHRTVLTGDFK